MSTDEWVDLRLKDRERLALEICGLRCRIEEFVDHWTWEVIGRAYQNAAQPSMGDKDKPFEARGKVNSKENAKRCVELICNIFVDSGLHDPTARRSR